MASDKEEMEPCPPTYEEIDLNSPDSPWIPYSGYSSFFHCGFSGVLSRDLPTETIPQNECFYDEGGNLVDENHPYAGCAGSPNEYDSSSSPLSHTVWDSGGILSSAGWNGFITSRSYSNESGSDESEIEEEPEPEQKGSNEEEFEDPAPDEIEDAEVTSSPGEVNEEELEDPDDYIEPVDSEAEEFEPIAGEIKASHSQGSRLEGSNDLDGDLDDEIEGDLDEDSEIEDFEPIAGEISQDEAVGSRWDDSDDLDEEDIDWDDSDELGEDEADFESFDSWDVSD